MQHQNLFHEMDRVLNEIDRIDKENPTGPDETDPRIVKLLDEAEEIQKKLDPLMRETFRNRPEVLGEWHSIMHSCDDLEK